MGESSLQHRLRTRLHAMRCDGCTALGEAGPWPEIFPLDSGFELVAPVVVAPWGSLGPCGRRFSQAGESNRVDALRGF